MATPVPEKKSIAIAKITDVALLAKKAQADVTAAVDSAALEKVRLSYLGRKGSVVLALRSMKDMTPEKKRELGPKLNDLRAELDQAIAKKSAQLNSATLEQQADREKIDVTEPVPHRSVGHLHPLEQARREVEDIFRSMGFEVVSVPEIDDDQNNFEVLNIPKDHPARDMWQTFWLKEKTEDGPLLLRTHTSNMQVRVMRARKSPMRVVNIGRVYRFENTDRTHEHTFMHFEGMVIDEASTLGDLRGVLQVLFETLFGKKLDIRMRPSYFPFVEPGVEFDVQCAFCEGKGCSLCKKTGWLEIGGAGMIHPTVLKNGGLNPAKHQGFAFGMGLDRLVMLTYGIDDIRLLRSGDLRFLEQF